VFLVEIEHRRLPDAVLNNTLSDFWRLHLEQDARAARAI
jgi:hypothetical protein